MKVCVYIGRFQPFHSGHLSVLRFALSQFDRVVVVLGSAQSFRDLAKNPFDAFYRMYMIAGSLTKDEVERTRFLYQNDSPGDNDLWVSYIVKYVNRYVNKLPVDQNESVEIFLTGSRKDESSFYLDLLPWEFVPAPPHGMINATDIRESFRTYIENEGAIEVLSGRFDELWGKDLTPATIKVMKAWLHESEIENLIASTEEMIQTPTWKLRIA